MLCKSRITRIPHSETQHVCKVCVVETDVTRQIVFYTMPIIYIRESSSPK